MTQTESPSKSLVTIIAPAYNEAGIIEHGVNAITDYVKTRPDYDWEILIVNDGSKDNTGAMADELAKTNPYLRVIHHPVNMNVGTALRTGFANARGEYMITLDLDLSYSVEHIGMLLDKIVSTHSDVVLASPYMKGGKVTAVPFTRKVFSRFANRYMSMISQEKFHTFTSMVRAYRGDFIRSLNLKARSVAVNPEIIYKGIILRAHMIEIPAHLDWSFQNKMGKVRTSSIRVYRSILSSLMSGFILRPFVFFLSVGMILLFISLYMIIWIIYHTFQIYPTVTSGGYFDDRFSMAIAEIFRQRPHAFLIGGFVLVVALQFISIGFLSLQNKRYFEETFHINTTILKQNLKKEKDK